MCVCVCVCVCVGGFIDSLVIPWLNIIQAFHKLNFRLILFNDGGGDVRLRETLCVAGWEQTMDKDEWVDDDEIALKGTTRCLFCDNHFDGVFEPLLLHMDKNHGFNLLSVKDKQREH